QVALRAGVADDVHRAVEPGQHRAAFWRQTDAPVRGPVGYVGVAATEIADRGATEHQQQREQPAVQTSEYLAHQPCSRSVERRRVASASEKPISRANHSRSALETRPRSSGCTCVLIASAL